MKNLKSQLPKQITFIQDSLPGVKAGEYELTLQHKLTSTGKVQINQQLNSVSKNFAISAERFSIKPNEINSVFPPKNFLGEFTDCLPHIVFNQEKLPWRRALDNTARDNNDSWLALLLFDAKSAPSLQKVTVADLVKKDVTIVAADGSTKLGTGTLTDTTMPFPFPVTKDGSIRLDYGEKPTDNCHIIDISKDTFNKLLPNTKDLQYLSHVRQLDYNPDNIEESGPEPIIPFYNFSLVVGNYLPQPGTESIVHLISVENYGSFLPDESYAPSSKVDSYDTVRLVSLYNWKFSTIDEKQSFCQLLNNVSLGDLQYPLAKEKISLDDDNPVTKALNMGYIACNHHNRKGGNMVSWYRGPLIPYKNTSTLKPPLTSADAVNRYNPDTGMFDASYSSAWQLGQLLALQDTQFSNALFQWKLDNQKYQIAQSEHEKINTAFGGIATQNSTNTNDHYRSVFSYLAESLGVHQQNTKIPPKHPQQISHKQANTVLAFPENIQTWINNKILLEGIPFNYLIPDEKMLPKESLRFFHLDEDWIISLLQGALSIGGSLSSPPSLPDLSDTTGFLLRSAAVKGWPGTKITALDDKNAKLSVIRLERLSDNILIGLIDGTFKTLQIHKPTEALHFGVEGNGDQLKTSLRTLSGSNPGHQIDGKYADVKVKSTDNRFIQASNTAASIKAAPALGDPDKFTSAEFALEMIKGVDQVIFTVSS